MLTRHPRYGDPLRDDPAETTRPRLDDRVIHAAHNRLTTRDRWLLALLHEHKTLTSHQIAELAFGHHSAANRRLLLLYRLRAVDRFRPFTRTGSAPWHYVLGDTGAIILAAQAGVTIGEFGYRRAEALAVARSSQLAHLVGVNGFFTALAAHARHHSDTDLLAWWPEHRCATAWGPTVQPDGFGRWTEDGCQIDFFLEHDTGTETLHRVAAKIPRYTRLITTTAITTPVLIWLHSTARETELHKLIRSTPIPIATASSSTTDTPAGPIWQLIGRSDRVRLADLATS